MSDKNAKLTVIAGANQGLNISLLDKPLLIGRGSNCDLPLLDNYASREHCWIEPRGDQWWIRDLGSKNGTRIEGKRIELEHHLNDQEVILIGVTQLRFSDPAQTKGYPIPPHLQERLAIDLPARQVSLEGKVLEPSLSPKQWALLTELWENRGKALSKDAIAQAVWPEADGIIYDYQIDKLVSRLRARLGTENEELIETVWGYGYRLK